MVKIIYEKIMIYNRNILILILRLVILFDV